MSDATRQWFYSIGGQNSGPLSSEQMRGLVANGTVRSDTLVWTAPMPEWLPLARTELGRGAPAVPPAASAPGFGAPAPQPQPAGMGQTDPNAVRSIGFGDAIKLGFEKYFAFSGRATRPEYWWFALFNMICSIIPLVNVIAAFALFIPMLSVSVRRLHDTDRSGWWLLAPAAMVAVPAGLLLALDMGTAGVIAGGVLALASFVMMLVFFCQPGTPGPNRFG